MDKRIKDMTGERFGRWVVLYYAYSKNRKTYWHCRCDCGTERDIRLDTVKNRENASCGCYHSEVMRSLDHSKMKHGSHGFGGTRLNIIWQKLRQRCLNKNHTAYHNYGGRGIKICDEWLSLETGFLSFREWALSHGYRDDLTLDRINNDGNYEPSNCRWATKIEQANNTRKNHIVVDNVNITQLSKILNICRSNLWHKLHRRNFNVEQFFSDYPEMRKVYETFKNRKS